MKNYLSLKTSYITLYQDFFSICPDSRPAGVILSYLYGWHRWNTEHRLQQKTENKAAAKEGQDLPHDEDFNESPWVYVEESKMCEGMFRLMSEKTFRNAIDYLQEQGFIVARRHPKYMYTSTKQYQLQLHVIQNAINSETEEFPLPDGNELNDLPTANLPSLNNKTAGASYNTINKDIYKNTENQINENDSLSEEEPHDDSPQFVKEEIITTVIPEKRKRGRPPKVRTEMPQEREHKERPINKRFELYKAYCECRGEDWNNNIGRDIKLKMFTSDFVEVMEPHDVKELYHYVLNKWTKIANSKGQSVAVPTITHLKRDHADWEAWKKSQKPKTNGAIDTEDKGQSWKDTTETPWMGPNETMEEKHARIKEMLRVSEERKTKYSSSVT